jgi:hypothetical protein
VIAVLSQGFRDLQLAENAAQEALLQAMKVWPETGLPANPEDTGGAKTSLSLTIVSVTASNWAIKLNECDSSVNYIRKFL